MSTDLRRTLAAALATLMALVALLPLFATTSWVLKAVGAVLVVAAAGALTRWLRVPRPLQPVIALMLLLAYLMVLFAGSTFSHALPTPSTVPYLRDLLDRARSDLALYAPPVPARAGLVLLAVAGAGAVALLVDTCAVVLDKVALSGLPLLALFAVPSALLPHGLGPWAFAIGASGWLVLLMEEGTERIRRWGSPLRSALPGAQAAGDDSSVGRMGRRIGAAAIGLSLVLPGVLPGLNGRLLGRTGAGDGGGSGPTSATTYNPITALRAQLTLSKPRQLFVYTTTDPQPDYLRMTTLDTYDGFGWSSARLVADRVKGRVRNGVPTPAGEDSAQPHQDLRMRVAIDHGNLDVHWLPVPYGPRSISVDGSWLWDASSQTVFSAARTTRDLPPYTVQASRVVPTRAELESSASGTIDQDVLAQYAGSLQVAPETVALVRAITRGATTPYDRAAAIQRFFTNPANGFVYDLNPSQAGPGEDPLTAFLRGRHGFCQQYATAMAVLLRLDGIPSRVAVGFTPGQLIATSSSTRTFSVTTSDAHAWPEAWFPGAGWVRFEPTPGARGATIPTYSQPTQAQQPSSTPTSAPTPQPTQSPGKNQFHGAQTLLDPSGQSSTPLLDPAGHAMAWSLAGAGLVLLLAAPGLVAVARRRIRARSGDALAVWDQLRDEAADVGLRWHAADSPRAAAARLAPHVGSAADALGRVAMAAEVARFAPAGRHTTTDLAGDGRQVRRALLASAARTVRLRAIVAPPSTWHWLERTAGARFGQALDAVDTALSWLFRPVARVLRIRASRS